MDKKVDKVYTNSVMETYTKVSGLMTILMATAQKDKMAEIYTQASFKTDKNTDMERILGHKDMYILVNGKVTLEIVMVE